MDRRGSLGAEQWYRSDEADLVRRYMFVAGAASVAGFVLIGAVVMPDGAALNPYAGLCQRALILILLFPCRMILVLGLRLLWVARGRP